MPTNDPTWRVNDVRDKPRPNDAGVSGETNRGGRGRGRGGRDAGAPEVASSRGASATSRRAEPGTRSSAWEARRKVCGRGRRLSHTSSAVVISPKVSTTMSTVSCTFWRKNPTRRDNPRSARTHPPCIRALEALKVCRHPPVHLVRVTIIVPPRLPPPPPASGPPVVGASSGPSSAV